MRKALTLFVLLLLGGTAYSAYRGPIAGDVQNSRFHFSHTSDWKTNQIGNVIQNMHNDSLVVFWPEGGILAPVERPIPPGQADTNRYFCLRDKLDINPSAQLFYGLSYMSTTAGVYSILQSAQQNAPSSAVDVPSAEANRIMKSNVVASTREEPIKFEVTSERIPNEFVKYTFEQNKPNYFALNVQQGLFKYFDAAKISVMPGAPEILKFGNLPLMERVPNFKEYAVFKPTSLKSVVTIPAKAVQTRRLLVLLVDQQMRILASGFVTLDVPE